MKGRDGKKPLPVMAYSEFANARLLAYCESTRLLPIPSLLLKQSLLIVYFEI